jgi:hypothetical protein
MNETWNQWLNETPQAGYFSWAGGLKGTPAMNRYYGNEYGNMYNRYMGTLGSQVQSGQAPTTSFVDWLKQFNATQNYQNQPNYMRGMNYGAFSPSRRWLIY